MSHTESKINAILDAWLEFIRLEDFSSARLPPDKTECQWVNLAGNNLLIEEKLFSKIQVSDAFGKAGNSQPTWVVSFPQVYKVEQNKSMLYPLFSLDVTPIFKDNYQPQGWNINEFALIEAGRNLVYFLNLEEEKLAQLITKEGLRRFLEDAFDVTEFESLEDWMRRFQLPGYRIIKKPYLFEFQGGGSSFHLKKDLNAIRETKDKKWLQPRHPAYEYLLGTPSSFIETGETLYLGAFPTFSPTDSQLKVLKYAQSQPVTAVQGPPGSGKTTLILHLVAQQVVRRALSLIETGKDINNLTVVSSTNHQAVNNVIDRLREDLPDGCLYLMGGSKQIIDRAGGAKEQLQNALDLLQKGSFDEPQQNALAQQIRQLKQNLVAQEQQYQEMRQQRQADEARLPEAHQEIRSIRQKLANAGTAREELEQRFASLAFYERLPVPAYGQLQTQFNRIRLELPQGSIPWWKNLFYWLLGRTEQQIFAKMLPRSQAAIDQTKGTEFEIKPPLDRYALLRQIQRLEEGLTCFQELGTVQTNLQRFSATMTELSQRHEARLGEVREIDRRLLEPLPDFYHTFHTQYHKQQCELFDLSQKFLTQEALKQKKEVKEALEVYQKVLSDGKSNRGKPIIPDQLCTTLSLMFPVVTCTLLSVRNMLPWLKECVDLVVVDESGMIPLHYTFPLLVRSRKAIVVGDPLQIEPIINQTEQTLDQYFQEAFLNQSLNQADYCRYSPSEIDTATTYHRAAGATGEKNDLGQGIRLLEHYRCQPSIIAYCEQIAKYGLIPKTTPKESLIGSNLIAYHVNGTITNNVNSDEVTAIHEVIQNLIKCGYSPEDIGVISMFRAQANALAKSLGAKFPALKGAIGTVHTFQGSERRVIILSTKVCRPQDKILWINQRPNLLNVAVSRAKELFILVGNLHRLEEEKSGIYTRQLVQHIREQGLILEYKTALEVNSERFSAAKSPLIYDCDHLEILERALHETEQELVVVDPQIQGEAAQKFSEAAIVALKRGINVTVVYGSPKGSADKIQESQTERKFRELFAKYSGARLIRAKKDGTNQRILLCDNKFAIVGSWNWLSHVYLSTCQQQKITPEAQIRREISAHLSEAGAIAAIRAEITDLIQESL